MPRTEDENVSFLSELRRSRSSCADPGTTPLADFERTRIATLVSGCGLAKASRLVGVSASCLEYTMQGRPVRDTTKARVVAGLDALYDALEPGSIRLARELCEGGLEP